MVDPKHPHKGKGKGGGQFAKKSGGKPETTIELWKRMSVKERQEALKAVGIEDSHDTYEVVDGEAVNVTKPISSVDNWLRIPTKYRGDLGKHLESRVDHSWMDEVDKSQFSFDPKKHPRKTKGKGGGQFAPLEKASAEAHEHTRKTNAATDGMAHSFSRRAAEHLSKGRLAAAAHAHSNAAKYHRKEADRAKKGNKEFHGSDHEAAKHELAADAHNRAAHKIKSAFYPNKLQGASSTAEKLSEMADRSGNRAHHRRAANAHYKAAEKYTEASEGDSSHLETARYHEKMWEHHSKIAGGHPNFGPPKFSKERRMKHNALTATFSLSDTPLATFDANDIRFVRRRAPVVFKIGDYPDKAFKLNLDEAREAQKSFRPIKFGLSHKETVLDGKLGELVKLDLDETGCFSGEADIPEWLDNYMREQGGYKLSAEWDRKTKRMIGCHFVPKARIEGAALTAAFEASQQLSQVPPTHQQGQPAGAAHGLKIWQSVCDMAEAALQDANAHPGTYNPKYIKELERLCSLAEKNGAKPKRQGGYPMANDPNAQGADVAKYEERIASLESKLNAEREKRLETEAAMFANEEISACRALPAEKPFLVDAYLQAARDDEREPAKFSDGKTRVQKLKEAHAARPVHKLLTAHGDVALDAQGKPVNAKVMFERETPNDGKEKEPSPERIKQLMEMTPTGRAVSSQLNGAK